VDADAAIMTGGWIKDDGWVDEGAGGEGTLIVRGGCGNMGEGRCGKGRIQCQNGKPHQSLPP